MIIFFKILRTDNRSLMPLPVWVEMSFVLCRLQWNQSEMYQWMVMCTCVCRCLQCHAFTFLKLSRLAVQEAFESYCKYLFVELQKERLHFCFCNAFALCGVVWCGMCVCGVRVSCCVCVLKQKEMNASACACDTPQVVRIAKERTTKGHNSFETIRTLFLLFVERCQLLGMLALQVRHATTHGKSDTLTGRTSKDPQNTTSDAGVVVNSK